MIKTLVFDLDNTIFPTKTITDEIFAGIYRLTAKQRGNLNNQDIENKN